MDCQWYDVFCLWWSFPRIELSADHNASVTSNHGPIWFSAPIWFLACKAEWRAHMNFYASVVLVVTLGYGPHTAWHHCTLIFLSNKPQKSVEVLYGTSTSIAQILHRTLFTVFHILWVPYRSPKGPMQDLQDQLKPVHVTLLVYIWEALMLSSSFVKLIRILRMFLIHLTIIIK